ncbi:MAG: zinc-ribbon domain-containing protein, partial [Deltaproteobacteria bacterium]|nr:zinc-ribbon domain-containing protein [Deltaproteobacteria bacterium]
MNINCPGCNFEYKLDERRIPAAGQKMRCPKCSTSFRVTQSGVVATDAPRASRDPFGSDSALPPVLGRPSNSATTEIDDPFGDPPATAPNGAKDSWGTFDLADDKPIAVDPFADPFGRTGGAGKPTAKGSA